MRKTLGTLALALFSLLGTTAYAQEGGTVSVPFGFVIKDHAFPAGHYLVLKYPNAPGVLFLRKDGSPSDCAALLVRPHEEADQDHFELQFSKTGDDMFLTKIRTRMGDADLPVLRPKGEARVPAEAKTLATNKPDK